MQPRHVVITGASSGIGYEIARHYAQRGCSLALVSRNHDRVTEAKARLEQLPGSGQILAFSANLAELSDVLSLASEIGAQFPSVDILYNNAGGYFTRRLYNSQGLELTAALNHLGYFRLSLALLPLLSEAAKQRTKTHPVRIVNTASAAHIGGQIELGSLADPSPFRPFQAYRNSKLANILFTRELARRLEGTKDRPIVANCFHPGFVKSNFGSAGPGSPASKFFRLAMSLFAIRAEDGARTGIWLGDSAEAAYFSGEYAYEMQISSPSRAARDTKTQKALWEWSLQKSPGLPDL